MARFEVPDGCVAQAYRFALDPTPDQVSALESHCGAARFAFNHMLGVVKANLDQRSAERSYGVAEDVLTPSQGWSLAKLRGTWNAHKDDVAPWWSVNSKEAYNSGLDALSRALENWSKSRSGERAGAAAGFPKLKAKHRSARSVRFTTGAIRVEPDRHHVTLPRLGAIRTHESTRKLARRLEDGTARVLSATVSFTGGRWQCAFQVIVAAKTRPAHARRSKHPAVGVDVGVKDLLVVATADAVVDRIPAPKPLARAQSRLRAAQRCAARRCGPFDPDTQTRREPSKRWQRANARVQRIHRQVAAIRAHEIHTATTGLATRHEVVAVEQLAVRNMARRGGRRKRGLNRALGDAALGRIRTQLGYKTTWYGTELVSAPRFFPSTQLCSRCGVKTKLWLRDRIYHCRSGCPPIDRDLNAAINLARLGDPSHGERGPVPAVRRPPASRLEMDVEPSRRPAPPPPRVRWGRQEAMKRQPRTPPRWVRGPLLRKERLPEMPSHTSTHISGNGDAMPDSLCRLSVQHGPQTVDLSLPRETPVGLLLPSIVDLVQRGGVAVDEGRHWHLSRVGQERLDTSATLRDNAVRDGELLLLTTSATPTPEWVQDDPWRTVVDTVDTGCVPTQVMATVAFLCTAVFGAAALVWSGVVTHATGHVVTGGAIAAAAAIGAVAARRAHPDAILCLTLSVVAIVFAAAAGFLAVPGGPSMANSLLAAAVACSTSILLLRVTHCGAICLTALATFTALTGSAAVCGVAWTLPVATTGAVLSALSLGALGVAARLSIAAAGLTPSMPSSDRRADDGPTSEMPRAVTAHHTLSALVIGSAGAAAVGAALVASACVHDGRIWPKGAVFAAVVGLVMVLRARTHIDMLRRTALVVGGMAAISAGVALVVVSTPGQANWVCLLVTAVGLSMLGGVFGATVNPLARRAVEVLEYLALAAVVPLACWVSGLYGLIRGVSLP